jgi:hypothetical protein
VFVYEIAPNRVFRPPITTRFATPSPRNLIRTNTSTELSRTSVGHTFPSDLPALNWDSDSGEAQQDSVARSSNPARHDLALVSLKLDRAPVDSESAASVSAIRSGESSVESRGGLGYYEGGLIDIASDRPRDRSLGQKLPGDWGPVKVESNVAAAQDDGIRRITELSQKPEAALDQESQPADKAQVTPVERALADNSEGGLIDLVEIKDAPQVLAEYPVMMAMHAAVEGGTESSDPIQVDRAIGFFRAFELAVAPEGVIEELIGEAVASPDEDSAIETPVSTDAGDFHPVVIPGAAVIPAVLMVGSWAVSTRRKPSRGKQSARGTV